MPNKILVATDALPLVWAAVIDYNEIGGVQTDTIELAILVPDAARQGDITDLDQGVVANRFPHKFAVTLRMAFEDDDLPQAGETIDLYWASSIGIGGPFLDGMNGSDGVYTGTTGSTITESLRQLQFLGRLILTFDGKTAAIQQTTFMTILPIQFGQPVIVNRTGAVLADDGEFLSITFTPYEYEVQ